MHSHSAHIVPYAQDPVKVLVSQLLENNQQALPNLTHILILLPDMAVASRVRQLLLTEAQKFDCHGLLGPDIQTLNNWLISTSTQTDHQPVSNYCRELILYDEICKHTDLYGKGNPWTLTNELLSLFDELNLNNSRLPENIDDFIQLLKKSYAISEGSISALSREATLVHTLWQAWHEQLNALRLMDKTTEYVLSLANDTNNPVNRDYKEVYLAGFYDFCNAELNWLNSHNSHLPQIFFHGQGHPDFEVNNTLRETDDTASPYTCCLSDIFNETDVTFRQRAKNCAGQFPVSPLKNKLRMFSSANAEDEAIAIDLQVRRWLLDGKTSIGIITENRRLARRVRALLDRANVSVSDYSGWALSTSSAATVIERWLQSIEEDFAYEPLVDFLKSPFIFPDWDMDDRLKTVYRLENDIILNENVPRNTNRYRKNIEYRKNKLLENSKDHYDQVLQLLDLLDQAARPLQALYNKNKYSTRTFLSSLNDSLNLLGISNAFDSDVAGERILQELEQMHIAAATYDAMLDWSGFRTWLGGSLEKYNFQPSQASSQVYLMGLSQSNLHVFDGVIIGSAEKEFLPGALTSSPFFNNVVRAELGLSPSTKKQSILFHHFKRLLEAAPEVLITHRYQQNGEDIIASPWLELIQSFHLIAYGEMLQDPVLEQLIHHPGTQVVNHNTGPMPGTVNQPRISIDPDLIPDKISASAHQMLIDCPYQYFASRCLELKPPEVIREALEKSDYGHRVHRCLEAFHGNVVILPGPFNKHMDVSTRADAIELLFEISSAVFKKDLEDNFQHRGWLKRWQAIIPSYIDWQIKRSEHWNIKQVELNQERTNFPGNLTLTGRIDRLDSTTKQYGIIDYKTGSPPSQEEVDSGEAIQLPFYALLAEETTDETMDSTIEHVTYLLLNDSKATSKASLQTDQLNSIKDQVATRMTQVMTELKEGKEAPAWGDEKICGYCTMEGLCRKTIWETNSGKVNEKN